MSVLKSRYAVLLTHGSAAVMTLALFALLLRVPFLWAFFPAVLLTHRIGVMMHEFIHGIPFRRYSHCLWVLGFFDGLMLMFGLLELFRATHLSHHRWLNSPGDSAFDNLSVEKKSNRILAALEALEVTQHLKFYWEALRGSHPYARRRWLLFGFFSSVCWAGFWFAAERPDIVWKLMLLTFFTTAVPVSLRGAIEHHDEQGKPAFANEYQVVIPLFNLNRHVHHHEQPRLPWYLLEFRTPEPLKWHLYFTYWFRTYIRKELVLMQPMVAPPTVRGASGDVSQAAAINV